MQLTEYILSMRELLDLPIPNKICSDNFQLQHDLVTIMRKCVYQLLTLLDVFAYTTLDSYLVTSIYKYLECSDMIINNHMYIREQVESTQHFADILKKKVQSIDKDFK